MNTIIISCIICSICTFPIVSSSIVSNIIIFIGRISRSSDYLQ